jgi:uncharacterized protein YndB with AHSA1/START domain
VNRIVLERILDASIEDVWELWTTREGIESWWGPEGFAVKVHELDLRAGGELRYEMIAVEAEKIAFMKKMGMPATHAARLTYTEVTPRSRLAWMHAADFIPGVKPYDVATVAEFSQDAEGVRLKLHLDRMHDDEWSQRMRQGWEEELGKLERALKR